MGSHLPTLFEREKVPTLLLPLLYTPSEQRTPSCLEES